MMYGLLLRKGDMPYIKPKQHSSFRGIATLSTRHGVMWT